MVALPSRTIHDSVRASLVEEQVAQRDGSADNVLGQRFPSLGGSSCSSSGDRFWGCGRTDPWSLPEADSLAIPALQELHEIEASRQEQAVPVGVSATQGSKHLREREDELPVGQAQQESLVHVLAQEQGALLGAGGAQVQQVRGGRFPWQR